MAYRNPGPFRLTAGEALAANRLVKISSNTAVYADAGDEPIGLTGDEAVADGAEAVIYPLDNSIHKVTAAGAIADGGALYVANDGKVDDAVVGTQIGVNVKGAAAEAGEILSAIMWGPRGGSDLATSRATTQYWMEDFVTGCTEDGHKFSESADKADWLLTIVDGDADGGEVCNVSDDAAGGWLTLTTNDKANDSNELQLNGESFKLATGKELRFKTRFMIGDVSATDVFIGLAITDTTVLAGATDRVGFQNDHDGNIDALVEQDSTESKTDTTTDMTDGSLATASTKSIVAEFYWDGAGVVYFYIDGVLAVTKTDNGTTIVIPDDEAMTPTICAKAIGAAAETIFIDYIEIVAER